MCAEQKVSRRRFLEIAGGTVVGLAVGGALGFNLRGPQVGPQPSPTATPTPTPTPIKPLKIGTPLPLTGTYASYGTTMNEGVETAIDILNEEGGLNGEPIQYFIRDSEMSPEVAVRRMKTLRDTEKIDCIVGALSSSVNFALNEMVKQDPMFFMCCNQTETEMHMKETLAPYVGFPMVINEQAAKANVNVSVNEMGPKHFLITVDYVWGHGVRDMQLKALDIFGGEEIGNVFVPVGTTDYTAALTLAREKHPDVLVLNISGEDQVNCMKQIKEYGIEKEMPVFAGLTTLIAAYEAGGAKTYEDVYAGIDWYYKMKDTNMPGADGAKKYYDIWMERYGHPPMDYGMGQFVGTMETVKAIDRAGSTDPYAIADELRGRQCEYHKGPMRWRECDLQAESNWFVVKGLSPDKVEGEWDFFEIVGAAGADNPEDFLTPCKDLGY